MTFDNHFLVPKGLPSRYSFSALDYSLPADTLLASIVVGNGPGSRHKVFARRTNEESYRELPYSETGDFSYRDLVVPPEATSVFLNQWRAEGGGFNWASVLECSLRDWRMTPVITEEDLNPLGAHETQWIAQLLGTDSRGVRLFCSLGTQASDGDGAVVYQFAILDRETKRLDRRSVLVGAYV